MPMLLIHTFWILIGFRNAKHIDKNLNYRFVGSIIINSHRDFMRQLWKDLWQEILNLRLSDILLTHAPGAHFPMCFFPFPAKHTS